MLRRPSHPGNVGDTPTRPALPPTLSTFHSSDVSGALGAAPVSKKYCRRFKRLMPGRRGTWVLPMRPATLEGPKARGKRRGEVPSPRLPHKEHTDLGSREAALRTEPQNHGLRRRPAQWLAGSRCTWGRFLCRGRGPGICRAWKRPHFRFDEENARLRHAPARVAV